MVQLFDIMRYYNNVSIIFDRDGSAGTYTKSKKNKWLELRLRPPSKSWIKITFRCFQKTVIKIDFIGYVMRDNHVNVIMAQGKRIGDSYIFVAECTWSNSSGYIEGYWTISWLSIHISRIKHQQRQKSNRQNACGIEQKNKKS